jgi:hypothetical protein
MYDASDGQATECLASAIAGYAGTTGWNLAGNERDAETGLDYFGVPPESLCNAIISPAPRGPAPASEGPWVLNRSGGRRSLVKFPVLKLRTVGRR